ncbi:MULTISPECIES: CBO0543 family protein [unclassified Paenibacillus]|uniref:CBO0543 family protein n=1 Tax=unclassified Paenibacillus TaxID=185978 RepID=UPI00277FA8BD|nr:MULTISPECIES: CBO0543 family protein [unclassified Paenibacillus]MDQ0903506.1 hypothetical protein [Paenibacillus sp. V4I7]MDQ0918016.1 hypothetical protein [Paenibacillus sp. V4I5]
MTDKQQEALRELTNSISTVTNDWTMYWKTYSNIGTWQFWVVMAFFIVPLIILVLKMDRKKAFRLGFYGLAIHVIAIYIDSYGTSHKMWEYPFKIFPYPPASFGLDASLIPVTYMLMYQWTLNRHKNYYVYLGLLSIVFAFVFKPLISWLELFHLVESSYVQLFIFYVVGGLLGKWLTDLFHLAQHRSER